MGNRVKIKAEDLIGKRYGNRIVICEIERGRNKYGEKVRMFRCKNIFNGTLQEVSFASLTQCGEKKKKPKDLKVISSGETISEVRIGQKVKCKYGVGTIVKEKMHSCILEMADGVETFRCVSKKELMTV